MGDRTYVSIRFSGQITAEQADELIQELDGQGCRCDDPDTGKLEPIQLTTSMFYDSECNYATMDGVEDFCREHSIAYCKTWEAGGDYGPGMEIFNGTNVISVGTIGGEPALSLSEIKRHGIGMLGFLESFENFDKHFPPVTIIEPETTEGEE
jgi:hypothetical protein